MIYGGVDFTPYFDKAELIDLLGELVKRRSESSEGREYEAAAFSENYMREMGLDTRLQETQDNRPNVIGTWKGTRGDKALLFNGHLDVVPVEPSQWRSPPYQMTECNGKLYGRGTADMKGGIAAALYAVKVLQKAGVRLKGDLKFVFTVDEELLNIGVKKVVEDPKGLKANWCIVGEPTGLDIAIGCRGLLVIDVEFEGVSCHAAQEQLGQNAVYMALPFMEEIQKLNEAYKRDPHPILGPATVNVTVIRGGEKENVIPDRCLVRLDRRLIPGSGKEKALADVKEILNRLNLEAKVTSCAFLNYAETSAEDPLVKTLKQHIEAVGRSPEITDFKASCEAPWFQDDLGLTTLTFGPGLIAQAHTVDEFVDIEELVDAAKVYITLYMDLLGFYRV